MRRLATGMVFTLLLLRLTPASAQLDEAECSTSWPGLPFPEELFLELAQNVAAAIAQYGRRETFPIYSLEF